jgi:hypothetical protein
MTSRAWRNGLLLAAILWSLLAFGASRAYGAFRSPWPTVTCDNDPRLLAAHAAGVYSPATRRVVLMPYVCNGIDALQAGAPVTDGRYLALFTLAHELSHASGIVNERAADCHAVGILGRVARHLAIPLETRKALAWLNGGYRWRCDRDHVPPAPA